MPDSTSPHLTPEELEIQARAEKATPGPWFWRKCYEMGDRTKHWALKNAESETNGRVLNLPFISFDSWSTPEQWRRQPDVIFIEAARTDIPKLLDSLAAVRRELAERQWIPVSERLPDENQRVFFYTHVSAIREGAYYNDYFWDEIGNWSKPFVSAWMPRQPLPAPPVQEPRK
jgi:hypothetical protein